MRSSLAVFLIAFPTMAAAQPSEPYPGPQPPQPAPPPQTYPQPQPQPQPYPYPQPQPQPQPQPPPQGYPPYAQPSPPMQPPVNAGARATFVSSTEKRWDVRIDDSAVCTTPCSIYVEPLRYVTMHSHDIRPTKLRVGHLPAGDLMVTAKPRAEALFATGVTFTSLGGMAAVTGITLTAVGCSVDDRRTMCKAGLITGAIGLVVTAGSIRMIQRSLPTFSVGGANGQPYVTGDQVGVAGSF